MTILPFQELTQQLEEALYRLHYTEASIVQYRRMWKRMATFFEQEEIAHFSEEAGMRFLDEQFNFFEREKAGKLTQSITNVLRIVRMLGDFQQHGSILRRYYKQRELLQTEGLKKVLQGYQAHCQQSAYANVTQHHYRKIGERFLSFLESQGIRQPADIVACHLSGYINTLLGYSYKTVELQLCGLRSFLRYLHDHGLHAEDLTSSIPALKARKQTRIPSVWTQEHIARLLEVIDRGNPAGKRDYAMLLLVTRLGLRSIDLKHLKLSDLKWRENRIELIQSKTASALNLPLLPEVGWAIIDYLKNGRPKVDSPYVFLRHLAPLAPFSDEDRLHQIVVKYMRLAKIPISPHKKKGMHSLRHTLASRLLAENTPLPVISDLLGHTSSDATAVYLKVDIHRLRECALNPAEGERHD
jgi:site-specific recombinase XerD